MAWPFFVISIIEYLSECHILMFITVLLWFPLCSYPVVSWKNQNPSSKTAILVVEPAEKKLILYQFLLDNTSCRENWSELGRERNMLKITLDVITLLLLGGALG